MSWDGPFRGVIRVGDVFVWAPYGHEAFGQASCSVEVTDITVGIDGSVDIWAARRLPPHGELEERDWPNDEPHFRDMVGEHDPIERRATGSPIPRVTTDLPRPIADRIREKGGVR